MDVTIAQSPDIPRLCELLAILFSQESEFAPNTDAQALGLSAIINCPEMGHVLVARRDHRIIGMVSLLYTASTALGEKVALLEDMVVEPGARGAGVGGRLLAKAVEHARRQGCKRITLLTDCDNERGQAFYRRHGFVNSTMLPMRLML